MKDIYVSGIVDVRNVGVFHSRSQTHGLWPLHQVKVCCIQQLKKLVGRQIHASMETVSLYLFSAFNLIGCVKNSLIKCCNK